jgi:hypothetical protein
MRENKIITVFGTARAQVGGPVYQLAYETGRQLALAGFDIANGGYGGTMEAAAKAAAEIGARTIGVTCSAFTTSRPNPYISQHIVTETLEQRLQTLIKLGEGFVVLPGGTGTLLELAYVWELKNKNFINAEKPVIIIGNFWCPLLELIATDDPEAVRYVQQVQTPAEAMRFLTTVPK